jgi:hypothetical protein
MKYGRNLTILGLFMLVKSGPEKIFLKFLKAEAIFSNLFYFIKGGHLQKITN